METSNHDMWGQLAAQLRIDSIRSTTAAGSGHPTSSMSAADLMAVLMAKFLRYDFADPKNAANDRLIFSKGHAAPLLYAMYKAAGAIDDDELMSLRKLGSRMQGHPNPRVLPWVDVATGSLGQGIAMGVGMALCGKKVTHQKFHVWTLLGDSEMAEGSVWEAFDKASYYKLNNLIAIVDMNRLGQQGETDLGWNGGAYAARARAFGWDAIELDGHDLAQVDKAMTEAIQAKERPICLIAKTIKGRGVSFLANKNGWHGKALTKDEAHQAIQELGGQRSVSINVQPPENVPQKPPLSSAMAPELHKPKINKPTYALGSEVATRQAFGDALVAIGARPDVVVFDGEVSNSTHTGEFKRTFPDRFFEMFIAEQQMISSAIGFAALGQTAFASTFACFFTRAYDQIRMGAVSNVNLRLCGSHGGVSIGEDGPSQMGLEDLSMMRAVHGSTVLYPCDAAQTVALVEIMADLKGISYMRSTRGKTPVIYDSKETFSIGGSKVLRSSPSDKIAIVAVGITVPEALSAYDQLKALGIDSRIIDAYSIKPIDRTALIEAARVTNGRFIVVEDHWPEGGVGSAVLEALADGGTKDLLLKQLAVRDMPGSGTPAQMLSEAGLDAAAIVRTVKEVLTLSKK